jgi:3-hydroxyisobutyrate dehydrogenase
MSTTKIGWIGLGKMGIPMSQQLINTGYPVTVYNRNKGKEDALKAKGAATAPTPAELLRQTDVVIVMVTDDKAINDIFKGDNGLLGANTSGKTIINMSSVSPAISVEIAALCLEQGNHYLDAPVSGSVKQAETAQLVIMAGGDSAVLETVKPVLEKMGKMVLLVGDTGAGNKAKLVINTMLGIYTQALAEAVVLANKHGISTENILELLNNGAMANPYIKIKGDAILNDNYAAAFTLKNIVKDLSLAKDIGLDTPLGNAAYKTFQEAGTLFGEEDLIAVVKQLKK